MLRAKNNFQVIKRVRKGDSRLRLSKTQQTATKPAPSPAYPPGRHI